MSDQDLDTAFELIDVNGGGDFDGKKDSTLIEKAENALGLRFPPTYKRFLAELGCGDIEGLEFYGIIGEDFERSSVPDSIWLTLNERKSGLPKNLILVCAVGDGTYYALDTSQVSSNEENPVVSYELNGSVKQVAADFGSFFLSELQTVLS